MTLSASQRRISPSLAVALLPLLIASSLLVSKLKLRVVSHLLSMQVFCHQFLGRKLTLTCPRRETASLSLCMASKVTMQAYVPSCTSTSIPLWHLAWVLLDVILFSNKWLIKGDFPTAGYPIRTGREREILWLYIWCLLWPLGFSLTSLASLYPFQVAFMPCLERYVAQALPITKP